MAAVMWKQISDDQGVGPFWTVWERVWWRSGGDNVTVVRDVGPTPLIVNPTGDRGSSFFKMSRGQQQHH